MKSNTIPLTPVAERFILHWGEMGTRWGINRTVAQVHALLFLVGRPLNAEEITNTLSVARSSVSTCLRELRGWGIVQPVHVLGDRRDHFVSVSDVWELFRIILEERKRREVDPTVALLRELADEGAVTGTEEDPAMTERLVQLKEFFETMNVWYDHIQRLSPSALSRFLRMGAKLEKLLGVRAS